MSGNAREVKDRDGTKRDDWAGYVKGTLQVAFDEKDRRVQRQFSRPKAFEKNRRRR